MNTDRSADIESAIPPADLPGELKNLTILYVEDDDALREEIAHFLERRVGQLIQASNGEEGLTLFRRHRPDIVITDITMPLMDGLALTAAIKQDDHATPVIITTAYNDASYLLQALSLNADGYVLKPIDLDKLMDTLLKRVASYVKDRELAISRARLAAYHRDAEEERALVIELMARMMRPENLEDVQLRYLLRPAATISGDLIAFARPRNGKLYLMLADSTGHGLPAALNLLPVNHIFYRMADKCLPIALIAEEMNQAVREQSPLDRYVSVLLASIDPDNRLVEVWNGGIPPATLIDAESGEPLATFDSMNLPLGVFRKELKQQTQIYQWDRPCQLLVYSDGLADAQGMDATEFGAERILRAMRGPAPQRLETLTALLAEHIGNRRPFDDMALALLDCLPAP